MIDLAAEYGPFQNIFSAVTALLALVGALAVALGAKDWKPYDEDYPKGLEKLLEVVAAGAVVLIWVTGRSIPTPAWVQLVLGICIGGLVVFVVVSIVVNSALIYKKPIEGSQNVVRLVGGFKLTATASGVKQSDHLTTKQVLERFAWDPDRVWVRGWRTVAISVVTVAYIALFVTGIVALGSMGIVIVGATGPQYPLLDPPQGDRSIPYDVASVFQKGNLKVTPSHIVSSVRLPEATVLISVGSIDCPRFTVGEAQAKEIYLPDTWYRIFFERISQDVITLQTLAEQPQGQHQGPCSPTYYATSIYSVYSATREVPPG